MKKKKTKTMDQYLRKTPQSESKTTGSKSKDTCSSDDDADDDDDVQILEEKTDVTQAKRFEMPPIGVNSKTVSNASSTATASVKPRRVAFTTLGPVGGVKASSQQKQETGEKGPTQEQNKVQEDMKDGCAEADETTG